MTSGIRVGIDVGGTHTDAALLDNGHVVAVHKDRTTEDVTSGIVAALATLLGQSGYSPTDLEAVMVGTTHFTNAFVEARDLASVAVVRLGYPATTSVPPLSDWPETLSAAIPWEWFLCRGGREFDGRPSTALDEAELIGVADRIRRAGLETVALTGVFAPLEPSSERAAAAVLAAHLPGIPITVSSDLGQLGFLARENAAVINSSLRLLARSTVAAIHSAMTEIGVQAPVYMSQNDGTLADLATTRRFPVSTFTSGPTNSLRGAAFLSGLSDCTVVDVGGTTADIGVVADGFPRETSTTAEIGGVATNFRLPDVVSLPIGGGSVVEPDSERPISRRSVGHRLLERALVFGGDTLTATDLAVAGGRARIGDPARVRDLPADLVSRGFRQIDDDVAAAVDRAQLRAGRPAVVLAGGGSILVSDSLAGIGRVIRPDHLAVANAIGAATGEIGATVERLLEYTDSERASAMAAVTEAARAQARALGADQAGLRVVDIEESVVPYLGGGRFRVRVRVVGPLEGKEAGVPTH
ncbi:hydantoinase/oxoprolinase family protein [Amnibacterium flavum]|uniref:hydantoinase/oxoprolinase family protein n=1 Tax=Amnibacterium flavum TaxID=2173173 RepID=UPI001F0C96DD|nr:hydantoinase/oxoprolinase family protein [Amnibacterium flavum]